MGLPTPAAAHGSGKHIQDSPVLRLRVLPCSSHGLQVGHAGTLDSMATGLLIVCTGRATRRIDSLLWLLIMCSRRATDAVVLKP